MGKNARTFGQDLTRGEHKVGAPKHSKDLRPDDPAARLAIRTASAPYREANARQTASLKGGTTFNLTAHPYDESADTTPTAGQTGTSIFDPVLTELAYRWFSPPGGIIIDPFAGGSVRGIVASRLDRYYVGCELRPEQVSANRAQAAKICKGFKTPIWHEGDSAKLIPSLNLQTDFIFSCHPAGVLLTTSRGLQPIEDVKEGDIVVSHKGETRRVTELIALKYTGNLLSIQRDYIDRPLMVTEEHPLFIERNGAREWRAASDLRVGDHLLEPVPLAPIVPLDGRAVWTFNPQPPSSGRTGRPAAGNREVIASSSLMLLLGYFLAEGWVGQEAAVRFAFNRAEQVHHEAVITAFRDTFGAGLGATIRPNTGENGVVVICNSSIAARFFSGVGGGAARKRFPPWVWGCSDALLLQTIRGLWAGDGWVEAGGRMGFASVSRDLVDDLRRALLRLGVVATYRCRKRGKTNYGPARPAHNLSVRGVYADRLAELLGGAIKTPPHRRPGRQPFIADGYVHYAVRCVGSQPVIDLPVFNIEVENDHSYLADGVASHNCPPYGDLEIYSDRADDLSNMPHERFVDLYRDIIAKACATLRDDRFACFVVGDFRDKAGNYRDFVSTTIRAFRDAGLALYNEVILVTAAGSLPIRAGKQFEATRKLGKALRNGTPVLTPTGWQPVESLRQGDDVIAVDGQPTQIMGVYPQGVRDLLTVTFEDGAEIDVDPDHLWEIQRRGTDAEVMTTAEILSRWGAVPADPRPAIPYCAPVQFPAQPTPVHPYLVGLLLGDGGLTGTTPILTSADPEIVDAALALSPPGVEIKSRGFDHRIVGTGARSLANPLTIELRAIGLMGKGAAEKRVPPAYLWNDKPTRLETLRGLMDSDGTVNKTGSSCVAEFCSISRGLCDDVAFLARSLGAKAVVAVANRATSGVSYRTRIVGGPNPFRLARKADIWAAWQERRSRTFVRRIKSIAPAEPGHATCIAVAHPRALFVAHDFIVTHNTHQNVLVFLKGDPRRATKACGKVEIDPAFFAGADDQGDDDQDEEGERRQPPRRKAAAAPPYSATPRREPIDDNTPDLTPIEQHGDVWLKRDDLWAIAGVAGGKVRTCWALAQAVKERPGAGLITAGSRASPQVNIVAHIAQRLGVPCRAHTPTGKLSPEVAAAQAAGAEIVQHKAGYNNVIVARAREDAAARGWVEIPFGMECEEATLQTRRQVRAIPEGVKRLVVPVGSGMSLAGILWGQCMATLKGEDVAAMLPVLGVVVGADPEKRIEKYAPPGWRDFVKLIPAGVDYHEPVTADVGGVLLDPHYEAKCARFLEPGDLLWIVGIRATA